MTPDSLLQGERMLDQRLRYGIGSLEWNQQSEQLEIWLVGHVTDIFAALRRDLGMPARDGAWPEQSLVTRRVPSAIERSVEHASHRRTAEQRVLDRHPELKERAQRK